MSFFLVIYTLTFTIKDFLYIYVYIDGDCCIINFFFQNGAEQRFSAGNLWKEAGGNKSFEEFWLKYYRQMQQSRL